MTDHFGEVKDLVTVNQQCFVKVLFWYVVHRRAIDAYDRIELFLELEFHIYVTWLQTAPTLCLERGVQLARYQDSLACAHQHDRTYERASWLQIWIQMADLLVQVKPPLGACLTLEKLGNIVVHAAVTLASLSLGRPIIGQSRLRVKMTAEPDQWSGLPAACPEGYSRRGCKLRYDAAA